MAGLFSLRPNGLRGSYKRSVKFGLATFLKMSYNVVTKSE